MTAPLARVRPLWGCDRKARGVCEHDKGTPRPAGDSPEKTLPVLPAMVARYWTRCWQLVVLPLPLAPSRTMAWSWRLISMLRYAACATA